MKTLRTRLPGTLRNKPNRKLQPSLSPTKQWANKKAQWRRYGLSPQGYSALLFDAGGVCEVCGSEEKLCVDHCHRSKRVRGILCDGCNKALGLLKDDAVRITKLLRYASERCRR